MANTKSILTEQQCSLILERFLNFKYFTLDSFNVDPLPSQMDGLIGEQYFLNTLYTIQNSEEQKTASFFLKMLSADNPVMFEISKSINAFEKEKFIYETVRPLLEQSGIDIDFMPNSYLCEAYTVVLEDLSLAGYKGFPKSKPLDVRHSKECLKALAKFHTATLLYETEKRKNNPSYSFYNEFRGIITDKVYCEEEENGGSRFIKCSFKALFKLIELVPSENGKGDIEFSNKLKSVLPQIMSSNDNSIEVKSTLLHGDLWSNNFLFKYKENNQPNNAKLIDFQTIKYGPPAMDVLQFIFTNTRKDFRDLHIEELLKYYHKVFSQLLYTNNNILSESVNSEKEFMASCEQLKIVGKVQSIIDRSITAMSEEIYLEAAKTPESFSNFLFEGRCDYIVNSFKIDKSYRNLMSEDIQDLRNLLMKNISLF